MHDRSSLATVPSLSLATVLLASVLSCADVFGPPRGPLIAVTFSTEASASAIGTLLADIDGRRVEVPTPEPGQIRQVDVRADNYGDALVTVALRSRSGVLLATDAFTQRFERSGTHWVSAHVGTLRPFGLCIGVLRAVPIAAAADTLFMMYGSLPEGAVC